MAAPFALTDAKVVINSVNLSAWVKKVTFPFSVNELDSTAMGGSWHSRIAGLKDGALTLDFMQDFSAAAVDATLWPLFGTVTAITVNPTSGANSATNPQYGGSVLVGQYKVVDGAVGDLAVVSFQWNTSGAWTRATS